MGAAPEARRVNPGEHADQRLFARNAIRDDLVADDQGEYFGRRFLGHVSNARFLRGHVSRGIVPASVGRGYPADGGTGALDVCVAGAVTVAGDVGFAENVTRPGARVAVAPCGCRGGLEDASTPTSATGGGRYRGAVPLL